MLNFDPVGFDLVVEGLAADAEALGGFQLVAAGFLERLDDGVAFHTFEQGETRVGAFRGSAFDVGDGKHGHIDFVALVQEHGALDFVLQLSDVARPLKPGQPFDGPGREAIDDVIGLGGKAFQE